MKRSIIAIFLLGSFFLTSGAFFVSNAVFAQVPRENTGIEEGYDDDSYDNCGCVWRDDVVENTLFCEEKEVPDEFFIKPEAPLPDPCKPGTPDWKNLSDFGESALWPIGCFNPLNIYDLILWIGVTGSFQMNKNYDSWDEFYYVAAGASNKRKDPPDVDIFFSDNSPSKGTKLTVSAFPKRYQTPLEELMYGWSTRKQGKEFISQQGLAAGGREITTTRDFNGSPNAERPACRRVTRVPGTDQDKDGMDDTWERQYGIYDEDPQEDIDKDGFDLNDAKYFDNDNPLPPDLEGKSDPYLEIRVTPDTTANSVTGDGKFTNQEEYIWGTNPHDPDSDDDGYADEVDIAGFGQNQIDAIVNIDQGDTSNNHMDFRVTTVGVSNFIDEANTGRTKILMDSDQATVYAGIGSDLEANLFQKVKTPVKSAVTGTSRLINNREIVVEADAFQTDADRAVLDYAWFVEFRSFGSDTLSKKITVPATEKSADPTTAEGRLGLYTFRHNVDQLVQSYAPEGFDGKPGDIVYVNVEVTNLKTHEASLKRIPITLGSEDQIQLQITDLNTNQTLEAFEYAAQYCQDVAAESGYPAPLFCSHRTTLNELLPWIVFEGSRVTVTANPLQTNQDDLDYVWWVNDKVITENYVDAKDNKLDILPEIGTGVYNVKVAAFQKGGEHERVFSSQIEMQVVGPTAVISLEPEGALAQDALDFTANLVNFSEDKVASYDWTITDPNNNETQITGKKFTFSDTATPGPYTVDLTINYQLDGGVNRNVTTSKTIVLGSPTPTTAFVASLASLAQFVQRASVGWIKFAALGFAVIILLFVALGLHKKNTQKPQ